MRDRSHIVWQVVAGDILDVQADALICSANPWLNLSGGVGGALALRYGVAMQEFLHRELASRGVKWLPAGTVVVAPACGTPYKAVVHAVGVDAMYKTSKAVVAMAVERALVEAGTYGAHIALTAVGTGYGPLSMEEFGEAILPLVTRGWGQIERVTVGVRHEDEAAVVRAVLGS